MNRAGSVAIRPPTPVVPLAREHQNRLRVARQIDEEDELAAGAIAMAGLSTLDLGDLLQRLVVRMVEVGGASVGGILLLDEEAQVLRPGAYQGLDVEELGDFSVPVGLGFAGKVAHERRPVTLFDVQHDPTLRNPYLRRLGIQSMLGVPIIVGDRLLGVAHVDRVDLHVFSPAETRRLQGMAAQAGMAIYHSLLHEELEAANRKLVNNNKRLEAVLNTMPAGVAILEAPSGRIIAVNEAAERLWGYSALPNAGLADLQHSYGLFRRNGELYDEELPFTRSLRYGEVVVGEEALLRQADGKEYPVLLSCAPLYDGDKIDAVVAVLQDTSRMELERVKDQFVSVTAHELFTPLTVIKGMTQLLERQASMASDRTLAQGLRVIDGRASWMTFLVQKLVDAAELQLDPLRLRRSRVDLAHLAQSVCRRAQAMAPANEIVLRCEGGDLLGVWDRDRIDRVLTNLLENAIKFSPEGAPVEVEVSRASAGPAAPVWMSDGEGWALIRVRDHGVGIAKEQLPNLFRRFYRAGPGAYQESAGLGLGLYIANRIVVAHGGHIGAESEEGAGSTFYFALPLAPGVATDETTQPATPAKL